MREAGSIRARASLLSVPRAGHGSLFQGLRRNSMIILQSGSLGGHKQAIRRALPFGTSSPYRTHGQIMDNELRGENDGHDYKTETTNIPHQ